MEFWEKVRPHRLRKNVRLLVFSVDIIDLNLSRLNVPFEMMILEGNMLCSRRELLRSCQRDTRLIVFPNFAVELWCFHQKRDHLVEFIHDGHQRNYLSQGRGQSNIFGFGRAQSNFGLELARPIYRTVGVLYDKARPRHQVACVMWVSLIPPTSKVSIDIALETLREIYFVFYSFIPRSE